MGRLTYIAQFAVVGVLIAFLAGPTTFDWLLGDTITRQLNPSYLAAMALYAAIGAMLGFVVTRFADTEESS